VERENPTVGLGPLGRKKERFSWACVFEMLLKRCRSAKEKPKEKGNTFGRGKEYAAAGRQKS